MASMADGNFFDLEKRVIYPNIPAGFNRFRASDLSEG